MSNIWLPGAGLVPAHIRTAQQAVEAYDSRLELGYDERAHQWVALWKDAVDGAPYPVMGLGRELPSYEKIQEILYRGDTVRNGAEVIKGINRRLAKRRTENRAELEDAGGEVAEALEHAFRRMGKTPYRRIYVPKGM